MQIVKIMRTIKHIIFTLLLFGLSYVGVGCDNDNDVAQSVTEIELTRVKSITYTSAVCVGYVVGGYSERGVCVATTPEPTLDARYVATTSAAQFEVALSGLTSGTTYYARTYAICDGKTIFGEQKQFATVSDGELLLEFSGATCSYTTALLEGYVVATGGKEITERGLCYADTPAPTVEDTSIAIEGGVGRMKSEISGLVDGKSYYGRVYVKIGSEYFYSTAEKFTTREYEMPTPTIVAVADIATTSITINANVAVSNLLPVTARGLAYGTTENLDDATIVAASTSAAGDYTLKIENLEQGEAYYIWAYADNQKGRAWSGKVLVKTKSELAQINLDNIADVVSRSALAKVTVTDLGIHSATIIDAGVCYGTTSKPTVANACSSVKSPAMGTFEGLRLATLKPATKYYVRAYVTNQYGTAYSVEQTITTRDDMYGTMIFPGVDGKTAPKFNAWQIIVKDVTSANNTNVPESVLSPGFKAIYDNITTAVDGYSGSYMNGIIYRLRPTTAGGVIMQMTLYYRSASKSLISTGWMNIEFIRNEVDGTFKFGQHAAWTSNVYKSNTTANKAYLDAITDYFAAHSFYFEWSTSDYEFGTKIDSETGPVRLVPVDDPDNYWSFTTKNYTSASDTSAIANPF